MKRISVVGPESSGKTTLTKYLSKTLKCNYSDEYARTYLDKKETYDVHDLIKIAKEQNRIITNNIKKGNDYFIADTSCLVIELWSRIKFNHVDVDLKYLSLNEKIITMTLILTVFSLIINTFFKKKNTNLVNILIEYKFSP